MLYCIFVLLTILFLVWVVCGFIFYTDIFHELKPMNLLQGFVLSVVCGPISFLMFIFIVIPLCCLLPKILNTKIDGSFSLIWNYLGSFGNKVIE